MEEMLTTVSSTADGELTIASALIAMGVSIAFGLVIALTYTITHSGRHQQSFAVTLTMLPVILAVIILFVGSNVARAFSLAGTLSIIRFRSAPGDPKDIAYIFFSIAAGLACGVVFLRRAFRCCAVSVHVRFDKDEFRRKQGPRQGAKDNRTGGPRLSRSV